MITRIAIAALWLVAVLIVVLALTLARDPDTLPHEGEITR